MQEIVTRLCAGEDLDRLSAEIFMEDLTDGCLDERQTAAILTALTQRPSEEEIAGCAAVLYRKKHRLKLVRESSQILLAQVEIAREALIYLLWLPYSHRVATWQLQSMVTERCPAKVAQLIFMKPWVLK